MRRLAHVIAIAELAFLGGFLLLPQTPSEGVTSNLASTVMVLVPIAVGWLLASRLPRNPVGWLLLGFAGGFVLAVPTQLLGAALVDTAPGVAVWLLWYTGEGDNTWLWVAPVGLLLMQIPLRFPDGRLPSPRWRWFSWFTILLIVVASATFSTLAVEFHGLPNPLHSPWVVANEWVFAVILGLAAVGIPGSVASLFVRYRRADDVQRTQLRWVAWAAGLAVLCYAAGLALPDEWGLTNWLAMTYALIPAAIGVAVLRYRLYDIDRVISRTVSYLLVTGLAVGLYALIVTAVSQVLPDQSSLAVAAATLVAAAAFWPVLRRVRQLVDRRFDRARYDAAKVVDSFGEHLRTTIDPAGTTGDLVRAIEQTLQPSAVGVWTRGGAL